MYKRQIALVASVWMLGCGSTPPPVVPIGKTPVVDGPAGTPVTKEAADAFATAVGEFKKHEDARSWDDAACGSVAKAFLDAGKAQPGKFPAAHYNAGVALAKCAKDVEAEAEFDLAQSEYKEIALASSDPKIKGDPEFHQVWVQKSLIRFRKGDVAGITEAINQISAKGFDPDGSKNVEAFVNLGMLYRERWNRDSSNSEVRLKDKYGFPDDLARAQFWLQNALAINDAFMPAYNQLALFYLDKAREVGLKTFAAASKLAKDKKATKAKADLQTMELALLVSQEASRRDAGYAGIWNTQGLILREMNRMGEAAQAYKKATEKDPKFFEAWMNYAAINLAFRGYSEAAKGYLAAKGIRTKDYDAYLGYAVATRGQLDFNLTSKQAMERKLGECSDAEKGATPGCMKAKAEFPPKIKDYEGKFQDFYKAAVAAYDEAQKIDEKRYEAFFNKALLVEKYKAKTGLATSGVAYREAEKLYEEVSTRFSGTVPAVAADAKKRAGYAADSAKFEEAAPATTPTAPTPPAAPAPSASK